MGQLLWRIPLQCLENSIEHSTIYNCLWLKNIMLFLSFNLLIMFTATNSLLLSNPLIECSYHTSFQLRRMFYLEIFHSSSLSKVTGPLLIAFLSAFIYFRVSIPRTNKNKNKKKRSQNYFLSFFYWNHFPWWYIPYTANCFFFFFFY